MSQDESRTRARLQVILQLLSVQGMDQVRISGLFDRLTATGGRVEYLGGYAQTDLVSGLGLSPEQASQFLAARSRVQDMTSRMVARGIHLVSRADIAWPANLLRDESRRTTPWLFVLGDPAILSLPSVGIAGSRDATERSLDITHGLAELLAQQGRAVVSGGARGIDSAAHAAALTAGGRTIVVLAQGLGTFHLPRRWHESMQAGQLAVVSEYLPMDEWEPFRAIQRNATIVQLGDAFVVVQAGAPSGSLSAGQNALKMRWPLSVVRQIGEGAESFPGNDLLIRQGGAPLDIALDQPMPVECVDHILAPRTTPPLPPAQLGLFS